MLKSLNKNKSRAGFTTYLSILTLNVNRLNSSMKIHCMANCIKKEDQINCCLQEMHLIDRNKHWVRVKDWKKIYQANGPLKQAGVTILISDKVDFKPTLVRQDKEGHFILIKKAIHQKEIIIINLYAPNVTQFHQTYTKNIYRLQCSGSGRL
jgi:exonuclease III